MRAVDTNILARYYLQDDAAQANLARGLLEDGDPFVPKAVLLELEWMLRGVAGQPRTTLRTASRLSGRVFCRVS